MLHSTKHLRTIISLPQHFDLEVVSSYLIHEFYFSTYSCKEVVEQPCVAIIHTIE